MLWCGGPNKIFGMWIATCLSIIFERTTLSLLYFLGTLVESQLTVDIRVYPDCQFYSIGLYVLMPLLYHLDSCSFIISFKIWKCEASQFVSLFFSKIVYWVPCLSIWILGSVCQFLQRSQLIFIEIMLNP